MRSGGLSRREFLKAAAAAGVAAYVVPLNEATAKLMAAPVVQPPNWTDGKGRVRFRQDGIPKAVGDKVFSVDIRARDMPGWPQEQAHATLLRVTKADRVYEGFDLSSLGDELQPDRLVTARDLADDNVVMPQPDFYGDLMLAEGKTPVFLGQPVALLIYNEYPRFRAAKARLRFNPSLIRYGEETGPVKREPYGSGRYVRVGGATPFDEDVFSPLKHNAGDAPAAHHEPESGTDEGQGVPKDAEFYGKQIQEEIENPPEDWAVFRRKYYSQSVEPAALEPDNGNCWYDSAKGAIHVVTSTQSPYTVATHVVDMVSNSRFRFSEIHFHPGYTVGYGQKEHSGFPYYCAMAALYGNGRPVRLALDRWEHFQSAIKRHAFWIDNTVAVDRKTGMFQSLFSRMRVDGGGRANFSASVGQVGATAMQSIYYFPKNDLAVTIEASRAVTAGSMRGYGTLQTMATTEMMVDEMAEELGVDPIEFRLKNNFRTGMKNTQGAIPAGTLRSHELLEKAKVHPLWTGRAENKRRYDADHPGFRYGVGFACVQKDYGTGAEASIAQVEIDRKGRVLLRHIVAEIGTGSTTSQMLVVADHLGRPADKAEFAIVDWPNLPLTTDNQPYSHTQDEEDKLAQNPHWVPRIASPRSASNSSYYSSHATREAARVLFEQGLWPAAVAIWTQGIGGGQAAPLTVRRDEALWADGKLTASSLEPLSLERLAETAHRIGLVTGAAVHTFNRWAWATADFEIDGQTFSAPVDALSLRWGEGASSQKRARMTDAGYAFQPRTKVSYPPVQRNNAAVTYYAPNAALVELAVNSGTGDVLLLSHHSLMECGRMIVPELVSGQLQGGIAMGIGHALYEDLPLYENGPGNGTWNFNRYRLPRATDVAVWTQTADILPPLSASDPPKGIAEVVMIPIVAAVANGVAHAIGHRFYDLPIKPEKVREVLA